MAFVFYNPNPKRITAGDCVIRAICLLTDRDWDDVYLSIAIQGFKEKEMPSANDVWGQYLFDLGFERKMLPASCCFDYTVSSFCREFSRGKFLLATGSHVVTVIDGNYYDTWDSGNEIPIYYWN